MTIEAIVARYGLAALFLGAGLEGEAAVVTGGVLAHRGLFPLPAAMAAAVAGSFVADQLWFFAGRRMRDRRWVQAAQRKPAFAKALAAFRRWPIGFIFAFRFLYGLRVVSPIAIGTTDVSARLFLAVNLASAIVWGVLFTTIGYLFGRAFQDALGRLLPTTTHLVWLAAAVVALGVAVAGVRWWRRA